MTLKRKTRLARGKPLARRTRMKARNPQRAAKTFARNFGTRAEAVRSMPCLALTAIGKWLWNDGDIGEEWKLCRGPVQAAHTIARGMGGAKGDRRHLVPLCAGHHAEAGEHGTTDRANFQRRYGLDLDAEAQRIAHQLDTEGHE